ncbi:membrane protein insertase YidC [Desulfolithobacter sp.]
MDMYRAFLAIVLSFIVLIGYQFFFVKPALQQQGGQQQPQQTQQTEQSKMTTGASAVKKTAPAAPATVPGQQAAVAASTQKVEVNPNARDIVIDTPLYTAIISEQGGGFKSFELKNYKRDNSENSPLMQLVKTRNPLDFPVLFTLDNGAAEDLPLYRADRDHITLSQEDQSTTLTMTARLSGGVVVTRTLVFDPSTYLIDTSYTVKNGDTPFQAAPAMVLTNKPFTEGTASSRYMFSGPVALVNDELHEIKGKKLSQGIQTLQGDVTWAAYEDNYFICALIPLESTTRMVTMAAAGEKVHTIVAEGVTQLAPGAVQEFKYKMYFGPKKLSILKETGYELSRAINFGWFDIIAKPMLWLLNFFYDYVGNYGVAIILLTVLIKGIFWPITSKGMKSMKNMQKLQPKVAKLKEKYKDDPQRMNQEMMALYKTYKVNPLGGCLPMFLQIPFFFALYKVLLMSIELRHAPFMLWITDLSAPDRLWIGIDIPVLHGIPVLTLLMGASMYLQQKMTPTTADPTQAKIMQWLPVLFTFMFINFASGLVLYWFVNNLLSILQQQLINRQTSKA